jgi:hypothetical protein
MTPIEKIKSLPRWAKGISAVITLVVTVVVGAIQFDGYIVDAKELEAHSQVAIETLQQMQTTLEAQMNMHRYDFIDSQYDKAKAKLLSEPDNPIFKMEYDELRKERELLRNKLGL